ncbi:hypothetical protein MNBD_GAMMA21-196 [hydrothermal vent metagenome]|uniref:Uncharacterized protein n=1 Tax=hydrothermal vent metagenome TaxID=652676 RepID=A0A3B1A6V3_9ZZZZ
MEDAVQAIDRVENEDLAIDNLHYSYGGSLTVFSGLG